MGLEESRTFAETLIRNAIDALSPFSEAAAPLQSLAAYIVTRNR